MFGQSADKRQRPAEHRLGPPEAAVPMTPPPFLHSWKGHAQYCLGPSFNLLKAADHPLGKRPLIGVCRG